jgi:hypothetical protein
MLLCRTVHVTQRAPCSHAHEPCLGIHADPTQRGHIEGDAAVRQREAGDVVTAAPDRELQLVLAREVDRPHDVIVGCRPHHDRRSLRDHPVPEGDRIGKSLIRGMEERSIELHREGGKAVLVHVPGAASETGDLHS